MLYGDIGEDWWSGQGITETQVLEGLKELDANASKHTVRLNTPGGRVDTGLAILTLLRSHKQQMKALNPAFQLETTCDGYAMSSGSVIFMAGDIRTVCLGGVLMIHDAWTGCYGNAQEMTKMAGVLEQLSTNCANIYAALCTPPAKDAAARDSTYFRSLMKEETYFIGDEAVNCGLATQQDINNTAQLCADLTPEKLKGNYVNRMTKHFQKRTFSRATNSQQLLSTKLAMQQLELLEATLLD